jgi:hypothetical protein
MKRILPCLLAAVLAVPAALPAAQFEGKINFKITSGGKPQEMNYIIKGDKMRLELPGQAGLGGIILDTTKKETTIVMDEQRMYMVQAMPAAASPSPADKADDGTTLEKTGEKDRILGYPAEKYISTSPQGQKTELWLAEGLGSFMAFSNSNPMGGGRRGGGGGSGGQAWERALAGKELFPLRVVSKDKDGKEFRMEATAIEKKSFPDSLFAPPADYQKLDMGNMMKGMMPGGRPAGGG